MPLVSVHWAVGWPMAGAQRALGWPLASVHSPGTLPTASWSSFGPLLRFVSGAGPVELCWRPTPSGYGLAAGPPAAPRHICLALTCCCCGWGSLGLAGIGAEINNINARASKVKPRQRGVKHIKWQFNGCQKTSKQNKCTYLPLFVLANVQMK